MYYILCDCKFGTGFVFRNRLKARPIVGPILVFRHSFPLANPQGLFA